MRQRILKSQSAQRTIRQVALALALIIGIILLIAAYGKFFYPVEHLKYFDGWIGGLEIAFAIAIIWLRKNWWAWIAMGLMFAAWCGYATFWYYLKLPCHCMGTMVEISTKLSIIIDLAFLLLSLIMSFLLGARFRYLYLTLLIALLMFLAGDTFADWSYQKFILQGGTP